MPLFSPNSFNFIFSFMTEGYLTILQNVVHVTSSYYVLLTFPILLHYIIISPASHYLSTCFCDMLCRLFCLIHSLMTCSCALLILFFVSLRLLWGGVFICLYVSISIKARRGFRPTRTSIRVGCELPGGWVLRLTSSPLEEQPVLFNTELFPWPCVLIFNIAFLKSPKK